MRTERCAVLGHVPSKSNTYEVVSYGRRSGIAKSDSVIRYEKSFFLQCPLRGMGITENFRLELDVYFRSNRSDLDNALKAVLDCLQKCRAIDNDRQCVEIAARKFVDAKNPRVEIVIETL